MTRWLLGSMVCVVAGCSPSLAPSPGDPALFDAGGPDPFAPVAVVVSPLTRVEPGPRGEPVLALYLSLVDRWGDETKAPAQFDVQLFRVSGVTGLAEGQDGWSWQIDLRDPDENSGWFDATGLYRLPLAGVPAWVAEPDASGGSGGEVARIQVIANVLGPDGEVVAPRDTFVKVLSP